MSRRAQVSQAYMGAVSQLEWQAEQQLEETGGLGALEVPEIIEDRQ